MIVDSGFLLQLDDALRPYGAARKFCRLPRLAGPPGRHSQSRDRRLAGRPYSLSRLLGQLAGSKYQRCAAQEHRGPDPEGESGGLRNRRRQSASRARVASLDANLGSGQVLIPGVISHATNVVEHRELVAERIVRLAKIVGRENVIAGTDCGFAQGPFYRRVHPSVMWAKLEALSEGARLASRELWS
jgi:hypothetical protein